MDKNDHIGTSNQAFQLPSSKLQKRVELGAPSKFNKQQQAAPVLPFLAGAEMIQLNGVEEYYQAKKASTQA